MPAAAGLRQADAREQPAPAREVRTAFLRVVDRSTRQPLSGVALTVSIDGKVVEERLTDDSGRIAIPLPAAKFDRLCVAARKDGLAPMKVYLRGFPAPPLEIPRSYTLAMQGATSIGGVVRDQAGQPLEGAAVTVSERGSRSGAREVLDLDGVSARSNGQGRWHIDLLPAGFDLRRLRVTFAHPDYYSPFEFSGFQPDATPEQLRSHGGVTVMYRGITVAGRVLDRAGRPIAGASVRLGDRALSPSTTTAADGGFRFRKARAGQSFLTVEAVGYAPEARPLHVRDGLPAIEFQLSPGRTIRGQVLDSIGKPLGRAYVGISRWNGPQTLNWRSQSDADGRFAWVGAPGDQFTLLAFKDGYRQAELTIEPADREAVFKLAVPSPLRILGTVSDAETGQPIETFRVLSSTGPFFVQMAEAAATHVGGRYLFDDVAHGPVLPNPDRGQGISAGSIPGISA